MCVFFFIARQMKSSVSIKIKNTRPVWHANTSENAANFKYFKVNMKNEAARQFKSTYSDFAPFGYDLIWFIVAYRSQYKLMLLDILKLFYFQFYCKLNGRNKQKLLINCAEIVFPCVYKIIFLLENKKHKNTK